MDNITSTGFDVFFNGVIPIIYAITYQLISQKTKCLVEDFTSFGLMPLVPMLYAISQNERLLLIAGIHSIYLVSELNSEVKGLVRIILFALPNDELKLEIKINKIIAHEIKPSLESLSELLKLQGSKPKQMAIFKYTLEKIEPELNLLSELLELQGENRLNKDIEKQMRKLEEIVEKIKEGQVESILQRFKPLDTIIKRWKNISTNSEERYVVTVEALEKR
ncbi:hypothetical protein GLOIN_2v1704769 [Rhizophagus clarus]|uniref:Uncharacterized protein n=1 Tax=Rhizophagus clarus TaxID=94130 RepID=A0A8H3LU56_9GLOM|nr:hypothetical protein GLOIN_2v1704769 [Rhizophagus clarus]